MKILLQSHWFISSCLLLLALFGWGGVGGVNAQTSTNTPAPTITRTPIHTFTPSPTFNPSFNRFNCPDETYYYDEVDIQYIAQCSHCLQHRAATRVAYGNQIPDAPINLSPLPLTPLQTEGTPSPSAAIPLTYVPTQTPAWMGTITLTPTNTLPPTPTELSTGVATFTLTPSLTPSLTPNPYYTEVYDLSISNGWQAVNPNTGALSNSVSIAGSPSISIAQSGAYWFLSSTIRSGIYASAFTSSPLSRVVGVQLLYSTTVTSASLTGSPQVAFYVGNEKIIIASGSTYRVAPAANATAGVDYVGAIHSFYLATPSGSDILLSAWSGGVGVPGGTPTLINDVDHAGIYMAVNPPGGNTTIKELYIWRMYDWTPEFTPTLSPTPTGSPTPTPTQTPNPNEVDCRFPFNHNNVPMIETDLTDSYSIVQQECYIIIPSGFYVDLSALNADWIIEISGLQVCVNFIALPNISIMGVNLPIGGLLVAVLAGFIFRRFATF